MTQFGMGSTMTPRNDASPSRGQWDLSNAYRYLSEAYGGYRFDVMHGINVHAGIFMSYIGCHGGKGGPKQSFSDLRRPSLGRSRHTGSPMLGDTEM